MQKFIRRIFKYKEPEDIDIEKELEEFSVPFRAGIFYVRQVAPHIRPYMEALGSETCVTSLDREISQFGEMLAVYLRSRGKNVTYLGIINASTKKGQETIRRNADNSQLFLQSNYSENTVKILEELARSEEGKGNKPWIYLGGTLEIQSYPILNSEKPSDNLIYEEKAMQVLKR